uniref:isochorismate synthase n=1 Tax=Rhodosorus marinus TaxID=101924 RepID=A0A7S3A4V6_9RHOD|mmetsp:Transcript_44852/g.174075  ORF Transcript_44852/g.174075 Transcript_44852/m.174075 type:complete len:510 (+) Transcript_44852:253-1782(+)|eukprot:CAMPEP_0113958982 /NCGR_PEP_ID=MMETSP0011_2-20120614/3863_1 /TAXON_ID=101924 /ORGANISM="Rhodosorus marinus" /LENGTH=509 /DNA_ID=CAMNT_0000970187 /DNA_START=105 /DNA_END=1634 /DNA_ORIENTATION=+ /assembly_acc=CAM_ASM_000156
MSIVEVGGVVVGRGPQGGLMCNGMGGAEVEVGDGEDVVQRLGEVCGVNEGLRKLLDGLRGCRGNSGWVRLEVEVSESERHSILEFVRSLGSCCQERFYYRSREGGVEVGGHGFAWKRESLDSLAKVGELCKGLRVYVAGKFDSERPGGSEWEDFGADGLVFVPLVEFREGGVLVLNVDRSQSRWREHSEGTLRQLITGHADDLVSWSAPLSHQSQGTSSEDWARSIKSIKDKFQAGESSKIVLARTFNFECEGTPPDPFSLLPLLHELTPNGFLFGLQPMKDKVFLGCSPEQLFFLESSEVLTESLAGTCAVDGNRKEAVEYILSSKKDRYEQGLVTQHIISSLQQCGARSVNGTHDIVHLPHLVHLRTKLSASLTERSLLDNATSLLQAMNPTPAVCGLPTSVAKSSLSDLEPFDRGLYSGPFGYVGKNSSEFCVSIRSALFVGQRMIVYAGAGIVPTSDPEQEWRETALKMIPFLQLLGEMDAEQAFEAACSDFPVHFMSPDTGSDD